MFLSVCLLTSLFVGSASACACSHHAPASEKVDTESSSCHSHAKDEKSKQETETDADSLASSDGCICAANAQRIAAKSEAAKLKKLLATIAQQTATESATREQLIATSTCFIAKPFYLSDSFYNLAPKRGPPRA